MRTLSCHRTGVWLLLIVAAVLSCGCASDISAAQVEQAQLPLELVETDLAPQSGKVLHLDEGDDLQAALEQAEPGDVIELEAGATFRGPFTLPEKAGEGWVVVRSSGLDDLPAPGSRVNPAHAPFMARLVSRSEPVVRAGSRAHHYRFIGLEISPAGKDESLLTGALSSLRQRLTGNASATDRGVLLKNLVLLGLGESKTEDVPHHIIFDRCYIHGDPQAGARRGIVMNGKHLAVIDSYLSDFKEVGADSQAIAGWNGAGPFRIVNNYLEGAGENVMFGGATPTIEGLVPADIEVRRNHFYKPMSWQIDHPEYIGTPWSVKNLFELKNARRVLVEGNVFEHNWPHAQNGLAVLFTVRNEGGAAPWATVQDITFRNNILRGVTGGINILGRDDNEHPSEQTSRIVISNNLFEDLGGGNAFQLLQGVDDILVEHNTIINQGNILFTEGPPNNRFTFTDNIVMHRNAGIAGSGTGTGNPTLQAYFHDVIMEGNLFVDGPNRRYPPGNDFPASLEDVGFIAPQNSDYRLQQANQTGSGEESESGEAGVPGVDFERLCAALAFTEQPPLCDSLLRK